MRVKTFLRREKEGSISYKDIADPTGVYEYPDVLMTMYMNTLVNNNSGRALRAGIDAILKRVESHRVRYILMDIKRSPSPVGRMNTYYSAMENGLKEVVEAFEKRSPQ